MKPWHKIRRLVNSAPELDLYDRVRAVERLLVRLRQGGKSDRERFYRRTLKFRERLAETLAETQLTDPQQVARAAMALELLVALDESPASVDERFPGLLEWTDEVALILGVNRQEKRRLRNHLLFKYYGDIGLVRREPHLLCEFFRLISEGTGQQRERAIRLYRALLEHHAPYVDYFLWFQLWREHQEGKFAEFDELFTTNDEQQVAAALGELMNDEATYDRMLQDHDPRHAGRSKFVLGRYTHQGLDHLQSLVKSSGIARWVDLAGGLSTPYLQEQLQLDGCPAVSLDVIPPDVDCLDHVLPLVRDKPRRVRVMSRTEVETYRQRMRSSSAQSLIVNLLDLEALRRALPAVDGPTLYTNGGCYLGSVRPADAELRRIARDHGVSIVRAGAMRLGENILSLLRPGDVVSLFGRARIPLLRSVRWLTLEVSPQNCLEVKAVAWLGEGEFKTKWELH